MFKGKFLNVLNIFVLLKDTDDLKLSNLKPASQILLMGTIGQVKEPVAQTKFMEEFTLTDSIVCRWIRFKRNSKFPLDLLIWETLVT
jgi:hypothetical protein